MCFFIEKFNLNAIIFAIQIYTNIFILIFSRLNASSEGKVIHLVMKFNQGNWVSYRVKNVSDGLCTLKFKRKKKRKIKSFTKYDISIFLTINVVSDAGNVGLSADDFDIVMFRCNCSTLFVQSLSWRCSTSKLADADANPSDIQPNGFALVTANLKINLLNL